MAKQIKQEAPKELSYYLTLYTLEGHTTWRADLRQHKDGFDKQWNSQTQGKVPKILKRHTIRIDRITGQIIPLQ